MAESSCKIENVGKSRNGTSRYWCRTHGADATGKGGVRLSQCERANVSIRPEECFVLNCEAYSGGVGIWGAVPPIFDTTTQHLESGVHVHAREEFPEDEKAIDGTFPAVRVVYKDDLFSERSEYITQEAAVNYFISRNLGVPLTCLHCPHCRHLHLDAGMFAVKPHRKHLCNGCGRHFADDKKSVSNPIVLLRKLLSDVDEERTFEKGNRTIDIRQADYPGGVQVWASNPAILWTAPRPEHTGLHVHLFSADGTRVEDDTFGAVTIDGIDIDEVLARTLMAQKALPHLEGKLDSIKCRSCGALHFDTDAHAFTPHNEHRCGSCGETFSSPRRKKLVSNPLMQKLATLVG